MATRRSRHPGPGHRVSHQAHWVPRAPHPYVGTVHTDVSWCVFYFLLQHLGGTPELVMRKFQECWAFPVLGAGPGTSKVAFAEAVGWALENAGSLVFPPHPCSRQPNIRPLHDRGLCEAHTASPWKASDTLTVWNSWLSWAEVGACVGVVGMVMVNSTQRVFRVFP